MTAEARKEEAHAPDSTPSIGTATPWDSPIEGAAGVALVAGSYGGPILTIDRTVFEMWLGYL